MNVLGHEVSSYFIMIFTCGIVSFLFWKVLVLDVRLDKANRRIKDLEAAVLDKHEKGIGYE